MEELSQFLNKKYKLASSENFDEFLKALGVNWMIRKVASNVSSVLELVEKDGEYCLTTSSTFKNMVVKFKIGEEFEEDIPDGQKVRSIITQEGNKLIQIQKGQKETRIVREFSEDEVKITITLDDVVCTRIYKPL